MSRIHAVFGDRFLVGERLGGGDWTDVFRAVDRESGALRAIKVLKDEFADNARLRARFLAEGRALTHIDHPYVLRVFDVVDPDGAPPMLVAEYAPGGSLRSRLDAGERFLVLDAIHLVVAVLRGLSAAHRLGIVHRDVEPGNVLIGENEVPKLADFGVARLGGAGQVMTMQGESLGSFAYMAPEQRYDAHDVDHRADLYGATATLFELLTGKAPPDLSLVAMSPKRLEVIPEPLRPIILRGGAYEATERYGSADEMADALRAAAGRLG